jgi:hypothetical protein
LTPSASSFGQQKFPAVAHSLGAYVLKRAFRLAERVDMHAALVRERVPADIRQRLVERQVRYLRRFPRRMIKLAYMLPYAVKAKL